MSNCGVEAKPMTDKNPIINAIFFSYRLSPLAFRDIPVAELPEISWLFVGLVPLLDKLLNALNAVDSDFDTLTLV